MSEVLQADSCLLPDTGRIAKALGGRWIPARNMYVLTSHRAILGRRFLDLGITALRARNGAKNCWWFQFPDGSKYTLRFAKKRIK